MSHIVVYRGLPHRSSPVGYWHHGILCPNQTVIHHVRHSVHFTIQRTPLSRFAYGTTRSTSSPEVYIVRHPNASPSADIIRRAESKLGTGYYNVAFNNCEHFARWCVYGHAVPISKQSALLGAAVLAGAAFAGPLGAAVAILSERVISSMPQAHPNYTRLGLQNNDSVSNCQATVHSQLPHRPNIYPQSPTSSTRNNAVGRASSEGRPNEQRQALENVGTSATPHISSNTEHQSQMAQSFCYPQPNNPQILGRHTSLQRQQRHRYGT